MQRKKKHVRCFLLAFVLDGTENRDVRAAKHRKPIIVVFFSSIDVRDGETVLNGTPESRTFEHVFVWLSSVDLFSLNHIWDCMCSHALTRAHTRPKF